MKTLVLLIFLLPILSFAQVVDFYVKPVNTNPGYASDEDSSYVLFNNTSPNNRLVLFFGGTGSSPDAYGAFLPYCAELGFHVISLSYLNSVAAASLSSSTDEYAFDNYRQEICFGTPASAAVDVDTLNSVFTRATNLLNYLNTTYPSDGWDNYLSGSEIDWTNIVVCGHSQGSGHAPYLARTYAVDRVIMFAGPNDYSDHFTASANWMETIGITPAFKHFSYCSLLDEVVDYEKQFSNASTMGLLALKDSIHVDNNSAPFNNSHILYTTQTPGFAILYHNSPTKNSVKNKEVWDYMLLTENLSFDEDELELLEFYPNPANDVLYIQSPIEDSNYKIFTMSGKLVQEGSISSDTPSIQVGSLCKGMHILRIGEFTAKFLVD